MSKHSDVMHHYSVRKRKLRLKSKASKSSNKLKDLMDKMIYPIGLLGPILTIPQLLEVWLKEDAGGVSLFTWSSWILISSVWLLYGVLHKEMPIIISNVFWIAVQTGVVYGVIIYS